MDVVTINRDMITNLSNLMIVRLKLGKNNSCSWPNGIPFEKFLCYLRHYTLLMHWTSTVGLVCSRHWPVLCCDRQYWRMCQEMCTDVLLVDFLEGGCSLIYFFTYLTHTIIKAGIFVGFVKRNKQNVGRPHYSKATGSSFKLLCLWFLIYDFS